MKKLLTTFIIWFIWFISFCSAWQVVDLLDLTTITDISIQSNQRTTIVDFWQTNNSYTVCFSFDNFRWNIQAGIGSNPNSQPWTNFTYWNDWNWNYVCFYKSIYDSYLNVRTDYSDDITLNYFILNDLLVYNIDTNYCVSNNLCPTSENSRSALYINDIQHEGAWTINITIPEEYDWDYTNENDEFNLDIIGYNLDTDYIEWIISNQTTKPNQTDLNNIISWVIPLFIPWLVIILFIYFVFKFLKKIF